MKCKLKVGDEVIECFTSTRQGHKSLTGKVIKIENGKIYIDRSDGQSWITEDRFYSITWKLLSEK